MLPSTTNKLIKQDFMLKFMFEGIFPVNVGDLKSAISEFDWLSIAFKREKDLTELYDGKKEKKELEIARKTETTLKYLANWINNSLDMKIGCVIQWKERERGEDEQDGDFGDFVIPREKKEVSYPGGLIRILEHPQRVDKILSDSHLDIYEFRVSDSSDTSGGVEKKDKHYLYRLAMTNGHCQTTNRWEEKEKNSYKSLCERFLQENAMKYKELGITQKGNPIDRMVLQGIDPISEARILLHFGIEKKPVLRFRKRKSANLSVSPLTKETNFDYLLPPP